MSEPDVQELTPFQGIIPDSAMADRNQAGFFGTIGRIRGLFGDISTWPDLGQLVRERSNALLEEQGEEAWRQGGGEYGADGRPTLGPRSQLGLEIVAELGRGSGKSTWTDSSGMRWAVRLMSAPGFGPSAYYGLAIQHPSIRQDQEIGTGIGLSRDRHGSDLTERLGSGSPSTPRMSLHERAEAILWAVHSAVLMQRRSLVLLPDVFLGQVVWGGHRPGWPRNWRQDLLDILNSLHFLHAAKLRFDEWSWQPRFEAHTVVLPYMVDLKGNCPNSSSPLDRCPIGRSGPPHGHFVVEIGRGFLGVLENYASDAVEADYSTRSFDFQRTPQGDHGNAIKSAKRVGDIISVSLPNKLMGRAKWSGLSSSQRRLYDGLVAELTRPPWRKQSERADGAQLQSGQLVPGPVGKLKIDCPSLRRDGRYVAFCGNGHRSGKGYRLIGDQATGWLAKCGCSIPEAANERRGAVRAFLGDLWHVAELIGLIVIAIDPRSWEWFDFDHMIAMSSAASEWSRLDRLHLRVYAPEDYQTRLRNHFAMRGGFISIPGALPGSSSAFATPVTQLGLAPRMARAGITQKELATRLGVSQSFVSQLVHGRRAWPSGMKERAEAFVGELDGE